LLPLLQVKKKSAPKPTSKKSKSPSKPGRKAKPKKPAARKKSVLAPARRAEPVAPVHTLTKAQALSLREALATARAAIDAAVAKKALLPMLIDVSGRASYADYICIVSGRSDRQVDAIADNVDKVMKERGRRLLGREGTSNGRWALLDFGDVVVHVFYHPVREIFDIESLWIDAPRVKLQVPAEAMVLDGPVGS
jgi:ribosome-associated protein